MILEIFFKLVRFELYFVPSKNVQSLIRTTTQHSCNFDVISRVVVGNVNELKY